MTTLYLIGGIVLLVGLALWLARREARSDALRDVAESGVNHAREANEIREDVRRLSDDQLYNELRDGK